MMSYYTNVDLVWEDKENLATQNHEFSFKLLQPIAEKWCDEMKCSREGLLTDLTSLLVRGSCYGFNKMYAGLILDLFYHISANFPNTRFIVRGTGEDYTDIWVRELLAGEVLFRSGPFEIDKQGHWKSWEF